MIFSKPSHYKISKLRKKDVQDTVVLSYSLVLTYTIKDIAQTPEEIKIRAFYFEKEKSKSAHLFCNFGYFQTHVNQLNWTKKKIIPKTISTY